MSYLKTGEEIDLDELGVRLLRIAFGDRMGASIFLIGMAFYALYWRVGIFSSDTYAVANTLVAVADGHLFLDRIVYGPSSIATPGLHEVGGNIYGRNYGHAFLALPLLLVLQVLSLVADLRLVLLGGWCLAVVGLVFRSIQKRGLGVQAAWLVAVGGGAVFVAPAVVATPLDRWWLPVIALQLVTLTAAALVGVFVYRLLARQATRRVAVVGGLGVSLATPVGFWASIPKRHSVTALLALLSLYALYRSREAPTVDGETRFRAVAYAPIGLTAWVHPAEALALLAAIAIVDLPTARSNRPRRLAVIAGAFAVSLLPFLVTNALISGNPVQPPRLLPGAGDDVIANASDGVAGGDRGATVAGGTGGSGDAAGGGGAESATGGATDEGIGGMTANGSGAPSTNEAPSRGTPSPNEGTSGGGMAIPGLLSAVLQRLPLLDAGLVDPIRRFGSRATQSIGAFGDGQRLMDVFVRSGYITFPPHVPKNRSINLTVLESMPMAGVILALPVLAGRRLCSGTGAGHSRPGRVTDLAAASLLLLLAMFYLLRLPAHHMFTVRYLHPAYPLAIYGLCRTAPVERVAETRPRLLAGAYLGGVALAVPGYVAALAATDAVLSEAVQLYGIVALALAGLVGTWAVAAGTTDGYERSGAIVLGVAAAATTTYLLVSGTALFAFTDNFALPVGRVLAEALRSVNPWESLW